MTLVYLCLAWLAGIFLGSLVQLPPAVSAAVCLLTIAAAGLWWKHDYIRIPAFCMLALVVAMARYTSALPAPEERSVGFYVGPRPVDVGVVVAAEPDVRDQDIRLTVQTYHIGSGTDSYDVAGKILVYVPALSDYRFGDDLLLSGVLQEPPQFDSLSYKDYLARQGVYAIMYRPRVTVIARDQGSPLLAAVYALKNRLQRAIVSYIPEPQAGLTQGVLLGVKAVIPDALKEDLARVGMTHVVVVSGYNLAVVAALMQRLTEKRLRKTLSLLFAWLGVLAFTVMVGATPPVARAALMISLALLARATGRDADAFTTLCLAGVLLTALTPSLLWDVSFQLSFLATAGLVLLATPLEDALQGLPWGLGAVLATTVAAQIATLPVIALNFQRISLISPLANLLVLPVIPGVMFFGALTAFLGMSGLGVVQFFGWLTWLLGAYAVDVMHRLGRLPQASVDLPVLAPSVQTQFIVTWYALVFLVFFAATHLSRRDFQALPQRVQALPGHVQTWVVDARGRAAAVSPSLVIGVLLVAATAVWLAVLLLLRS